jgi:hypothetical protein
VRPDGSMLPAGAVVAQSNAPALVAQ